MKVYEMITLLGCYNPNAEIAIINDCGKEKKISKIYGFHLISKNNKEDVQKYYEKLKSGEVIQDYEPCDFVGITHENTKNLI